MTRKIGLGLLAGLLVAACTPNVPTTTTGAKDTTRKKTESPSPSPSASASIAPAASFTGQVLGLNGQPAANVTVKGYLVSNNGSNLIGNNGSGYRLAQAGGSSAVPEAFTGETQTDSQGRFSLKHPEGKALNIEAVAEPTVKAIQLGVASAATDLKLQLAKTGTISGKVTAPKAPTVTDFEGVDVFIPGTGYTAKAAKDGSYTLTNVPVGSFTLVATKTGLGRAEATGVKVESEKTTTAALALSIAAPTLTQLDALNGGEGATVTLTGTEFGAAAGKTFAVTVGGVAVSAPERVSDTTLKITVPANAPSGDVVVTVDGIASNALPFGVIKKLYVPARVRHMKVGTSLAPDVIAEDVDGEAIATPTVSWASEDAAVAIESGKLVAKAVGQATVKVTSGTVAQTAVVKVYDAPGVLVTLAGGDVDFADGIGDVARFKHAQAIAVAPDGTVYMADSGNDRIRRITPDGRAVTIAGTGAAGFTDGPGANAQFDSPVSVALDLEGGLLVVDRNNHRIRRIDLKDPDFKVSTFAGNGTQAHTNGPRASASFKYPSGVEVSPAGVIFVTESDTGIIRKIGLDDTVSNFSGIGPGAADGGPAVARFSDTVGDMTFDDNGNMYVADVRNYCVRKVTADGTVTTLAGSVQGQADGIGPAAKFQYLSTLAYDGKGTLYIGETLPIYDDGTGNIRKLNLATREVTQWKTNPGGGIGAVDGTLATAGMGKPSDLAFDAQGNLVMLDSTSWTCRVRLFKFFDD